jgi:ketosteroid isomerase-like protein
MSRSTHSADTSQNQRMVERLVAGINGRDLRIMDEVFADQAVMDWPQSGERIAGAINRREIYRRFPTLPHITPRRYLAEGHVVVLEARMDYGGPAYDAVFIFEFRDGKIARETAYWSEPFDAPAWRAEWVERIPSTRFV